MSEPKPTGAGAMTELAVSAEQYRRLDLGSKLVGLVLLAFALEVGIVSIAGAGLAIAGLAVGVCTVFITEDTT